MSFHRHGEQLLALHASVPVCGVAVAAAVLGRRPAAVLLDALTVDAQA